MKMKSAELSGDRLHYAVVLMLDAEFKPNSIGAQEAYVNKKYVGGFVTRTARGVSMPMSIFAPSMKSGSSAQIGEAIIEQHVGSIERTDAESGWRATSAKDSSITASGKSIREAGLRVSVLGHFGETVEIPEWLD